MRDPNRDVVGEVEAQEDRLDRVIAARFARQDAEQEIDLRLRDNAGDARHAVSAPREFDVAHVNPEPREVVRADQRDRDERRDVEERAPRSTRPTG